MCKNECNLDFGECCVAKKSKDDFYEMNTDEFTVDELSCIDNKDSKFDAYCKR